MSARIPLPDYVPASANDPAGIAPLPNLRGHMPPLDGLRGIAVLAVMAFHFSEFSGISASTTALGVWHAIASVGWIGVDLFFVLSGFLITGILLDSRGGAGYFRTFYARRALRIFPLYYGVLVAFFVVLPLLVPGSDAVRANTSSQVWYWAHLSNVQIAVEGWSASSFYLVHFWSLAIEEQFYLVWPLVVLLLSGRQLARLCAGMMVFSLLLRTYLFATGSEVGAYVLTPARMDTLAFGALLAVALRDPVMHAHVRRLARPVVAVSAALLCAIILWRGGLDKTEAVTGTAGFTLLGALFAATLLLAVMSARGSRWNRILSGRGLGFFGKYSYALYVFHQPIALLLAGAGLPVLLGRFGAPELAAQMIYAAVALSLSVGVSLLSWNVYEKQFLKLKDRLASRPTDTAPAVPEYMGTANVLG